jgi:C-terminal processing protease CtpA/Prc
MKTFVSGGVFLFCSLMSIAVFPAKVFSDTIVMKDDQRLKGVIVEDYQDRVMLSTMNGEKTLMKDGIANIIYDQEEQNLANLGDFYMDRKMYDKAHYYYNKALEVNPGYKRAKDGLTYAGTHLQQSTRLEKLDHIQRLNDVKAWASGKKTADEGRTDTLKDVLGISLQNDQGNYKVANVVPSSPAEKAGVAKGDIVYSAWGRPLAYMSPDEVLDKLLSPGIMDVQVIIIRNIQLPLKGGMGTYKDALGAELAYSDMEGLIVKNIRSGSPAAMAGLNNKDVVINIGEDSTRYMSLEEAGRLIEAGKGANININVKRETVIWKKFQAES